MLKQDKNLTPQIIHLCQQLVRTPSVNGLNPEIALAQVIMDFARQNGLQSELLALEEDRPNVLVRVGDSEEIGLLLVGHMGHRPDREPGKLEVSSLFRHNQREPALRTGSH